MPTHRPLSTPGPSSNNSTRVKVKARSAPITISSTGQTQQLEHGQDAGESTSSSSSSALFSHEPAPSPSATSAATGIGMRFKKKDRRSSGGSDDVESQNKSRHGGRGKSLSSRLLAKASSTTSSTVASTPIKILLRKIVHAVLTDLDDETLRREDTETILVIITLIKEAMLGVFLSFLLVSLILLLDHLFVLRLPTARNFRKATAELVSDKQTMRHLEEESRLKFMQMEDYYGMVEEIALSTNKTILGKSVLGLKRTELVEMKAEMKVRQEEYAKVMPKAMRLYDFSKFCEGCLYSYQPKTTTQGPEVPATTCMEAMRKQTRRYKHNDFRAMAIVMETGLFCTKSEEVEDIENRYQTMEDQIKALVKFWNRNKKNFCLECDYDQGFQCVDKIAYIHERVGLKTHEAAAFIMADKPACANSYYMPKSTEEWKRMREKDKRFCPDCTWGWMRGTKMTCLRRMQFMAMSGHTEESAKRMVSERPACVMNDVAIAAKSPAVDGVASKIALSISDTKKKIMTQDDGTIEKSGLADMQKTRAVTMESILLKEGGPAVVRDLNKTKKNVNNNKITMR